MRNRQNMNIKAIAWLVALTMLTGYLQAADKTEAASNASVNSTEKVTPQKRIQFEQDKARAHMQELEERMFRLSKLIQESQPEDAARLLLGLRKAREQLILDRMGEASKMLDDLKLNQANKEQKEILILLEELKKLLLTADLGLELKLEQLRKLIDSRETLNKLIKKEELQLSNTLEQQKNKQTDRKKFQALETSERRNQKSAETLQQQLREYGAASKGICNSLSGAGKCMGGACKKLGESKPKPASQEQKKAIEQLSQAQLETKKLEEQLRKEVESLVRQHVMDQLKDMIVQQKQVREVTTKLQDRVAQKQKQALAAVRRLSQSEEKIITVCSESIELCELTQFSLVLPVALGAVREQMEFVNEGLLQGQADQEIIDDQRQIEKDLQALLDAMQEASRPVSKNGGGQCKGCKGNRNKLLAEVKMLRWMQQSVHQRTENLDQQIAKKKISADSQQERLDLLTIRQKEIDTITGRLHSMTCPHCLGGE
ncbi:hypothetical protein [Gimesia panareensis]|uniref:Uncharacterized protein n=1 Tax=Gimesia panareensis TaxID=2527978 RepID=A0A518A6Q8_9PLAN|nr:hypothetical protein [Gimesia panareensis]QDT26686.1 hypothetical protein Enr10x_19960 [Gimesia panareensis]QDU50412.1 hypothetical protein Pan110_27580 [Gimesia panareensis]